MTIFEYLLANWPWLLTSGVVVYLTSLIVKFVKHRRFYADLPTPPHSLILGNLKILGNSLKKYPSDFHPQVMFGDIALQYGLKGIYYVDVYPFDEPIAVILDPALALQIQTSPLFNRHPLTLQTLRGLVGSKSIFATNGHEWQKQRSWFAPAFAMNHLLTLVQGIAEETMIFRDSLKKLSETGEIFSLNELLTRLTFDVIGQTVGNIKFKAQTENSEIYNEFGITANWMPWVTGQMAPFWKKWIGRWMMDYHTKKLDGLLIEKINEEYQRSKGDVVDKSILSLAMKGYLKESGKTGEEAELDGEFMRIALDNAKTFLIAGQDTTASLMTYAYYYLSINPTILARVREEHNQIFGDLSSTIEHLKASPQLLNQLPLTQAVHKEVLRLHSIGMTIKKAVPGATVTYEGRTYPMDNHMVGILSSDMGRSPAYWTEPESFNPDRFLRLEEGESVDGLKGEGNKPKNVAAWQPFEKGPRNCIGQQLSLLEAKVISVLTVRWYDFEAVFKEDGPEIKGWGGKAYQEFKSAAKPKDGLRMKVSLVDG